MPNDRRYSQRHVHSTLLRYITVDYDILTYRPTRRDVDCTSTKFCTSRSGSHGLFFRNVSDESTVLYKGKHLFSSKLILLSYFQPTTKVNCLKP